MRGPQVGVYDHEGAVQEVTVVRMEADVDVVVDDVVLASKPVGLGERG